MMELKKVQGDNIPKVIEYLGMNEWAVRWDIEEVNSEDIHGYAYYELKFNEEPTYDSFVSRVIRTKYSADEEAALKSNMVEQFMNGEIIRSRFEEWQAFQECRNNLNLLVDKYLISNYGNQSKK